MRSSARTLVVGFAAFAALIRAATLEAHGFVGDRFFPPTITTDDPFPVDEFSLPTITFIPGSANRETDYSFEFDKEIFHHFALGISDTYISQTGRGGAPSAHGFDDVELSAKYEFFESDPREAILALGLKTDLGGSGNKSVADTSSTFIPTLYYGKGLGDLPDSLGALKPLAVTGTLGQSFPSNSDAVSQFQWAFAFEYSLPYLQQDVKDLSLPSPFRDMIPLVECSFQTDENRASRGTTTGTINPGILWESRYFQVGAEALIPINRDSGPHVGFIIQSWIFIDDLFPKIFGHPLLGKD